MRTQSVAMVALLAGMSAGAGAQEYEIEMIPSFTPGYGLAECYVWDINDQGVATGTATIQIGGSTGYTGFYWDPVNKKTPVGLSWPRAASNTGFIAAVGEVYHVPTGTSSPVPLLPGTYGAAQLYGVNDAGVAVGYVQTCNCSNSNGMLQIPYVWDALGGARTIAVTGAKDLVRINNHNLAVGNIKFSGGVTDGFVHDLNTGVTTTFNALLPPPSLGTPWSRAADVSDSGLVAGWGHAESAYAGRGFVWSAAAGFTFIPGPGPGYHPDTQPAGVNSEGVVAGAAFLSNGSSRAMVWDAQNGTRDLNTLTATPPGFVMLRATAINENGWIVGFGNGGGFGFYASFVLRPIAGCYADCNGDGTLNLADFGCFQTRFATGDPSADCNGDALLNLADFGCFQSKFAIGCP